MTDLREPVFFSTIAVKKISPLLAVWLACAAVSCGTRAPDNDPHMSCVERLEVPAFPGVAEFAQVDTGVAAAVLLAQDGSVKEVSFDVTKGMDYAGKLFFPAIEKALRSSQFAASCGGITVRMIFDFPLPIRSEAGETIQTVRFKHPNRFEVALTPAPTRWYTIQ